MPDSLTHSFTAHRSYDGVAQHLGGVALRGFGRCAFLRTTTAFADVHTHLNYGAYVCYLPPHYIPPRVGLHILAPALTAFYLDGACSRDFNTLNHKSEERRL